MSLLVFVDIPLPNAKDVQGDRSVQMANGMGERLTGANMLR